MTSLERVWNGGHCIPHPPLLLPLFCTACILSRPLVAHKGPPGGLADVCRLDSEPLLEAAVARYRRKHAAVVVVGCIENDPAVRREAGRLVARAVGQGLALPALEVHCHQLEAPADARNVREGLAVRADARRNVVVAIEGHSRRVAPARGHSVDLRAPAPVRSEVDRLTIGGEKWFRIDGAGCGKSP